MTTQSVPNTPREKANAVRDALVSYAREKGAVGINSEVAGDGSSVKVMYTAYGEPRDVTVWLQPTTLQAASPPTQGRTAQSDARGDATASALEAARAEGRAEGLRKGREEATTIVKERADLLHRLADTLDDLHADLLDAR